MLLRWTHPRDHFVYAPSQWEVTLQCNVTSHWLGACRVLICWTHPRDHFVYAPSQWEATLQCTVASHWLGACTVLLRWIYPGDHFVHALSQWEATLQCNVVSHWLGTYKKINVLVQQRLNSIANALELHVSCTNPSKWSMHPFKQYAIWLWGIDSRYMFWTHN